MNVPSRSVKTVTTLPNENKIFIANLTGANPFSVSLPKEIDLTGWVLTEFTFSGVPVTSGVPDEMFYNLHLDNIPNCSTSEWIRNDNNAGIPLGLSGEFTHERPQDMEILRFSSTKPVSSFRIRFTNGSDGSTLSQFSKCCLWLKKLEL